MHVRSVLTFVIAIAVAIISGTAPAIAQESPIDAALASQASAASGLPASALTLGDRVVINHELTGVEITAAKFVDMATGQAYIAAVDAAGEKADIDAAAKAEEEAFVKAHGKVNPRLGAKLDKLRGRETIDVSIWLNADNPPASRSSDGAATAELARAELNSQLAAVADFVKPKRQAVLDEISKMGAKASTPLYGPAVFAKLTKAQVMQLARHDDVNTIYGPEEYASFEDDAATTHRANNVWNSGNLGAGFASRPVIHEPDGIADYNPLLNNLTHPVLLWCAAASATCPLGKNIGDHATEVAGVIAANHALHRGIAPNAQMLLSANSQDFSDANLVAAFEWARGNGGDPTNMSWGTICGGFQTFMSRYVDWATRNLAATFVIASGNHPSGCPVAIDDEKVAAPGLAWGVITVGSQEDDNNGFWAGDSMSGFSDWRNPDFLPSMEKPEVVAVGQDVMTTDAAFGDNLTPAGVNGTSFAAPQVAGQVTQMLSRRPGQNTWPETNKAAVLVSAFHDIEGGLADRSRDGVGSVVMSQSDTTYLNNLFINDSVGAASFPRNKLDVITANAGQKVRVAIAWDSVSNGSTSDVLGADIDMCVRNPANVAIACSVSFDNAWEMVEFIAPATGTYDITTSLFSSIAGWPGTFMGFAWAVSSTPNFCSGSQNVPAAGGVFNVNTANGPTYFDSYAGWGFGQTGRERVLKLTLATTKDITVTDTNGSLDLHIMQISACGANPIVPVMKASGINSASVDNAPAGVYYIVVDGFAGAVGTTTATVSVTGP